MKTKPEIRREMKRLTDAFCTEQAEREAAVIWNQLESTSEFQRASDILIYMDIPGEVPTREFIRKWDGRKRFFLPRVNGDQLDILPYSPGSTKNGYLGIEEPDGEPLQELSSIDLAIIPGVAFMRNSDGTVTRLGHGKGFYDRLLPQISCPTVGIGFSYRWVDSIPADRWDIPLSDGLGDR